jgi:hypothetical protein
MANEVEVIPTTVDYTNRDYYSLREAMIARVKDRLTENNVPRWTGTDPNDFGLALIEAFAYMGDVMSYYIDRVANEMSIETASQRESILSLSAMFGYTPAGYQSATSTFTLSNSLSSEQTLPAGTQFSGSYTSGDTTVRVIFETASAAVIPGAASGIPGLVTGVPAYHGESIALRNEPDEYGGTGELIGVSDGSANQTMRLFENQVVENSIRVFVLRGTTYEEWSPVTRLIDSDSFDTVFSTRIDANDFMYVTFGDGISGKIPPPNARILVQYIVGGGDGGRVPANIGFTLEKIPGVSDISALLGTISVTNTAGVGGSSPESSATIRRNAPFALTTLRRAVSLEDYGNITLNSAEVAKANATASSFTSVTVYVAPVADNNPQDPYPGYEPTTYEDNYPENIADSLLLAEWEPALAGAVTELEGTTQIGVSYTVSPPTYAPVVLVVKYTKATPQHSTADIESNIASILDAAYGYTAMSFEQTIYPEEIEAWLRQTPGTKFVSVSALHRLNAPEFRGPLVGSAGEIFRITAGNTTIEESGASSTLSSLAVLGDGGTTISLSDTFSGSQTEYTATTTSDTARVSLGLPPGATAQAGLAPNIYAYNPTAQATLAVSPTNVITVEVTSENGLSTTTYTVTINKTA